MMNKNQKTTDTDTNNGENEETQTFESYTAYTSSDISEYSDALHKEIFYLKQGKGKKYKIVNGNRLNVSDKGILHIHSRWRQSFIFRMMHL